jgi:hypothetical protein
VGGFPEWHNKFGMDLQHRDSGIHKPVFKAGLHYGDHHSKLVHFEAQQNIFYVKKP